MKLFDTVRGKLAAMPRGPITWVVLPFAFLWYIVSELRDEIYGKGSRWLSYLFGEPLIFLLSYWATVQLTGANLSTLRGWSVLYTLGVWLLFELFISPLIYLWLAKPVTTWVFDTVWPKIEKFDEKQFGPFLTGFVNVTSKVAVGSSWIWNRVNEDSWAIRSLQVLGVLASVGFTLYSGWRLHGVVIDVAAALHLVAAVPTTIVGSVVDICAYILAFAAVFLVGSLLIGAFAYSKKQGVGLAIGVAGAWASHGLVAYVAAAYGFGVWAAYLGTTLTAVIITNYIVPTVVAVVSTGFIIEVWKKYIEPVQKAFFASRETGYRHIVGQLAAVIGALIVFHFALVEASLVGLGILIAVPIAVIPAFLALVWLGEWLDDGDGNYAFALLLAVASAYFGHQLWLSHGFWLGEWGAYGVGIVAAYLAGGLVLPLLAQGLEGLSTGGPRRLKAAEWLGAQVSLAHKALWDKCYKPLEQACESVYESGYTATNKSEKLKNFRQVVLHLTNIALAIAVGGATCWGTSNLLAAYPDLALFGFSINWLVAVIGYAAASVFAFLSYSLIGHLILEAGFEIAGFFAGLLAGVFTSVLLAPVQPQGWFFAVPIGLVAMAIVFGLVAPSLIYVVQSFGALTPTWVLTPFVSVNDWAFKKTLKYWDRLVAVRKWLGEVFGPIFKTVKELVDALRGKKPAQ